MGIEVETVELPEQPALCVRFRTSMDKIKDDIGRSYGAIFAQIGKAGAVPAGEPLALYYDVEMDPSNIDVETCMPVAGEVEGEGEVTYCVLPGGRFVSTVHRGPYETMEQTYVELFAYLKENGLALTGPTREVYLTDPSQLQRPEDNLTRILFPVR
jgi:effector-binding domain-containing protein